VIPVAVVVTALLAGLATWLQSGGIQDDLSSRSRSALDAAGLHGGNVEFSGRQATLSGFAAEQAGQAMGVVQNVDGVESVTVSGGGGPARPVPSPSAATTPPSSPAPSSSAPPPSSPAPPPTDQAGIQAELDQKLSAAPISFEPDSASLTSDGEQAARDIAPILRDAPDNLRYRIVGQVADGPGGRSAALKLSRQRALTVIRLLIGEGVPSDRLLAVAGADSSDTSDRRVEITAEQR